MKNLMILSFLIGLTASPSSRADDPMFSFAAAEEAFRAARAPTLEELLGDWMAIGIASATKQIEDDSGWSDGYYPEGRLILKSSPGYYLFFHLYQAKTDVFEKTRLIVTEKTVGNETGYVYFEASSSVAIKSTGIERKVFTAKCYVTNLECRLTENNLLLCGGTRTPKPGCPAIYPANIPQRYLGFQKIKD